MEYRRAGFQMPVVLIRFCKRSVLFVSRISPGQVPAGYLYQAWVEGVSQDAPWSDSSWARLHSNGLIFCQTGGRCLPGRLTPGPGL